MIQESFWGFSFINKQRIILLNIFFNLSSALQSWARIFRRLFSNLFENSLLKIMAQLHCMYGRVEGLFFPLYILSWCIVINSYCPSSLNFSNFLECTLNNAWLVFINIWEGSKLELYTFLNYKFMFYVNYMQQQKNVGWKLDNETNPKLFICQFIE